MQTKFNYVKPSECNIDYHNLINYAKRLEDFVQLLPNQSTSSKTKTQSQNNTKKTENNPPANNQTKAGTAKTQTKTETVKTDEVKDGEAGGTDDNK